MRKGRGRGRAAPHGGKAPLLQRKRGSERRHRGGFARGETEPGRRRPEELRAGLVAATHRSGIRPTWATTRPGRGHTCRGCRPPPPQAPDPLQVPPAGCKGRHSPLLQNAAHPETPGRSHRFRRPHDASGALPHSGRRPPRPFPAATPARLTSLSLPGRARGAGGAVRGVSGGAGPGRGGSASRWAAGSSGGSSSRGGRPVR